MKKCPYCAEEIQDDAVKCRHCNEFLDKKAIESLAKSQQEGTPWYYRTSVIMIGFVFAGPLVLPLVWINPNWSLNRKIIVTILTLVISIIIGKAFLVSMKSLNQYYGVLQGNY